MKYSNKNYFGWALQLKKFIEKLDRIIFQNMPARVSIRKASKKNFKVAYTHPSRSGGGGDYYSVYIRELGIDIEDGEEKLIMALQKSGRVKVLSPDKTPSPSPEAIIVSLAAHEVRHRMQQHKKIQFLLQNLPRKQSSELLKEAKSYVDFCFNVSRLEKDAMILETMVLHNFRPGDPLKKILPLIRLGAH